MRITDEAVPDVPDVPELVRYGNYIDNRMHVKPTGEYVRYDQAAAILAAKDALIFEHQNENVTLQICLDKVLKRAEAAEAELAKIKAQEPVGYRKALSDIDGHFTYSNKNLGGDWQPLYAAPIDQTAEIERLRGIALSLCDHMEMVSADLFDKTKSQQNQNISSMRIAIDEARATLSEKDPS